MARDRELDLVEQDEEIEEDEEEDDEELEDAVVDEGAGALAGFIGGLLLGAVIGVGITLLVAPERGEVTRRRLRSRLRDAQDGARDRLGHWRDDAGRRLKRERRRLRRRLRSHGH